MKAHRAEAHSIDKPTHVTKPKHADAGFEHVLTTARATAAEAPAAAKPGASRARRSNTLDDAHLLALAGATTASVHIMLFDTKTPEHKSAAPITDALKSATKHNGGALLDRLATPAHAANRKSASRHEEPELKVQSAASPTVATTPHATHVMRTEEVSAPAPVAAPLQALPPSVLEDPSLRIVVMPNVARMHVTTRDAGQVAIEVKVRDGVTDVRATGAAGPMLALHQDELRVDLAKEGLAMGTFDLTQHSSSRDRQADDERRNSLSPRPASTRERERSTEDGFHVKA